MPMFLSTYDLKKTKPDPYELFKDVALKREWYDWVIDLTEEVAKNLPNTTLQKTCPDMAAAVASFERVVADVKKALPTLIVENVIIVEVEAVRVWGDGDTFG